MPFALCRKNPPVFLPHVCNAFQEAVYLHGPMSYWMAPSCHCCILLIIAKILIFSCAVSTSSFCFWATPVPRPYSLPQYFASSIVSSKNNCKKEKKTLWCWLHQYTFCHILKFKPTNIPLSFWRMPSLWVVSQNQLDAAFQSSADLVGQQLPEGLPATK